MTVEAAVPKTIFPTIAGIGPYAIGWPYGGTDVIVTVVDDGVRTVLTSADFSLSPASSPTSGSVFLTPAAATLYAGAQLIAERSTPEEQGWTGVYPGEKGIEAQLDRTTRRIQEISRNQQGTLRIDGTTEPGSVATDRLLLWDGTKIVPGPTADEIPAAQGYAEEARAWAIEDVDVPVQVGLFSARHYATKAAQSAAAAAISQAAINLPALTGQDNNFLQVLSPPTGYRLRTPQQVREIDLGISGPGGTVAVTITNLNTQATGGQFFAASGATGSPNAEPILVKHYIADTTARSVQEVFGLTSGRRWMRVETASAWGAWVEIPGGGGITVAMLAAAAVRIVAEGYASPLDTELATAAWAKGYADGVAIGVNQTWQDVNASRTSGVAYRNTTGRPIMVVISRDSSGVESFEISDDGVTWSTLAATGGSGNDSARFQVIVPNQLFYRYNGGASSANSWWELR